MTTLQRTGETSLRIAAALKARISRFELPDGYRLIEEDLCEEFGVSRSPVRQALRQLTSEGYVSAVPRAGFRVKQPTLKGVEDLYELRLALETMVVTKLAGQQWEEEPIWMGRLRQMPVTNDNLAQADRRFHEGLAEAQGNEPILSSLQAVNDRLMVFREMEAEISTRPEETVRQHAAVLDAILTGDPEAAREAITRNIVGALAQIEILLGRALVRGLEATQATTRSTPERN